jgi:hypothetical protein
MHEALCIICYSQIENLNFNVSTPDVKAFGELFSSISPASATFTAAPISPA